MERIQQAAVTSDNMGGSANFAVITCKSTHKCVNVRHAALAYEMTGLLHAWIFFWSLIFINFKRMEAT